jgi:hypothetical protein
MRAELSPVSGGADADEISAREIARKSVAGASSRLFQDDVFERAARRPLMALG